MTSNLTSSYLIGLIPTIFGIVVGIYPQISEDGGENFGITFAFLQIFVIIFFMRFFMKNSLEKAEIREAFEGLNFDIYIKFVGLYFIMTIKILLWSLLLVIPGIYKSFEYMFVPYVFLDDPTRSFDECFAISRKMTDGIKMDLFITGLSFIGWEFLSILTCGILLPFVSAYQQQTFSDIYYSLK